MAFGKRKKAPTKVESVEVKEALKETEEVIEEKHQENLEKIEAIEVKPKTIKKGSKVVVSGRCFGSSLLECPMESVKDYATKILEIENGNYLIDKGWISPKSIKA